MTRPDDSERNPPWLWLIVLFGPINQLRVWWRRRR